MLNEIRQYDQEVLHKLYQDKAINYIIANNTRYKLTEEQKDLLAQGKPIVLHKSEVV